VLEKTISKEMFDALVTLFQSDNMSQKMILKAKLKECRMTHSDNVTSYLMRITQIHDQLAAIGEVVLDAKLVNVALKFTKAWEPFIMGIYAREHFPKWERLWDDYIQEETRRESRSSKQGEGGEDENLALVNKSKKGRSKVFIKKVDNQGEGQQSGQKRDMIKIKCYIFHKNGHFASQCP
jgi:hypothetical protein